MSDGTSKQVYNAFRLAVRQTFETRGINPTINRFGDDEYMVQTPLGLYRCHVHPFLARLVRRWFVPRDEHEAMKQTLSMACNHIIRHHEAGIEQHAGCFCPVCHHKDGGAGRVVVWLYTLEVSKETPCGWWLRNGAWVSKTAVKRYAYPTKDEAWASFQARKKRQITILASRLQHAREAASLPQPP